jgi:thiol:disulfide interchange protein
MQSSGPLRSSDLADSYAGVLLLVLVTYVVSVSVTESRAASIVLTVQLATVWFTLRTSQARPIVRRLADVVLCLAGVVAVVSSRTVPVTSWAESSPSVACSTSSRRSPSSAIWYCGKG